MKLQYDFPAMIIFFLLASVSISSAQKVEATIKGIRSSKGHIAIWVFKDNKSYDDKNPAQKIKYPKKTMVNGSMKVVIDLEPGVYGLSLLDDENSNSKMDYNVVHMPKEGFAFSDYYLSGFTKPGFDDFKFEIPQSETRKVEMKIRYVL